MQPDLVTYNIMLDHCTFANDIKQAEELRHRVTEVEHLLPYTNIVDTMMTVYLHSGKVTEGL
jgi:hypothetical protein